MVDTNPSKSAPLGGAHRTLTIEKGLPLGGQVLFVGGAAGISEEGIFHGVSVRIRPRFCKSFRTSYMRHV